VHGQKQKCQKIHCKKVSFLQKYVFCHVLNNHDFSNENTKGIIVAKYVDDSTFLTAPVGGQKKKIGENMILPCARRDNS